MPSSVTTSANHSRLQGPGRHRCSGDGGYGVRPATRFDPSLGRNRVCRQVHGHDRGGTARRGPEGAASVVEHEGRITGYATTLGFFGHAVGESNSELQALIGGPETFAGPGFLLPIRNTKRSSALVWLVCALRSR